HNNTMTNNTQTQTQEASMYKAVAFDLDGTLLNSEKKVTENTKRVLQYIKQNKPGVELVLASGRAPYLIMPTEEAAGVDCDLVGYNGGMCLSKKSEGRSVIFSKPIPPTRLDSIYHYVEENNLCLNVYGDGIVYAVTKQKQKADNYATLTGASYKFVDSYFDLAKDLNPMKCLVITESDEECDALLAKLKPIFHDLSLVKSNCFGKTLKQYYVEFLQAGVNKGLSVKQYCDIKGIATEHLLAFGDAENDIDMLQIAGHGVCMANGNDVTKNESNRVSNYTNDQDGVARELVEIFQLPHDLIQ
ncbi:hypothetical protein SAMD00019534_022630, partial [Acytostelium subglobosum LB1]|uniref:hypothetical protein n=1 Tax=Acytostelium subglobosum LB1 TaxID=1410327 RepID=UPI00064489FC